MKSNRLPALALVAALLPGAGAAAAGEAAPPSKSPEAPGIMLGADPAWAAGLDGNYALKAAPEAGQAGALKSVAGTWDRRFVGDLFQDGTPGALLVKLSPSGKTATRFEVLRWEKGAWKPMIRCGGKKLVYGRRPPITSTEPIDVYQVYLQRQPEGLGFMITLGNAGDKLFGDAVSLSYDAKGGAYVEPDDNDHD